MTIEATAYSLFPSLVMQFDLSKEFSDEHMLELSENNPGHTPHALQHKGKSSYTNNLNFLHDFPWLNKAFSQCVAEYATVAGLQNIVIRGSWTNQMGEEGRTILHRHEGSVVSGAFYFDCDDDSVPLVVHSPIRPYRMAEIHKEVTKWNEYTQELPCINYMLYIFPSWMDHETTINSTKMRNVISFNTFYP